MYTPLLPKDVGEKGPWYNVRREVFDNFLVQACKRNNNITLREKCEVTGTIIENGQVAGVKFRNEKGKIEEALARVVVAADGSASAVANSLGFSPKIKGWYAINCRPYFTNVADGRDASKLNYLK